MIRKLLRPILSVLLRTPEIRVVALAALYSTVIAGCIVLAYLLRFDFALPEWIGGHFPSILITSVCIHLLCMIGFRQFDGLLSYFSTPDLRRLMLACLVAVGILGAMRLALGVDFAPPRGVLLMHYFLSVVGLSSLRLTFRTLRRIEAQEAPTPKVRLRRVGIFGIGDCGAALAKDLLKKPWLGMKPVAFFDDFRNSRCSIHGISLVGRPEMIPEVRAKLEMEEILIATPNATPKRIRDILRLCHEAGISCRTVPSVEKLATGEISAGNLRPVEIHDLLGRDPVVIEGSAVREEIEGRIVLVTGAGGSIGSELCRQILTYKPAALVLVERSEPQLFTIEQELRSKGSRIEIVPVVGDITQRIRMVEVFKRMRPEIIFHAAAHKHVPMMEAQPAEAIGNNLFGSALLADLAIEFGVQRFIHISTDKAVNPTNVMGATKRLAEIYLQSLSTRTSDTKFMAVRFGNVLGSSGSVVPTFKRQIADGGPVTVTHPEVTRYFMTIPEAVSLVLQASAFGKGGEIFILDMGKPVKIVDLAVQMIALSGLKPHEDIEIRFTGLRPGEKLYEELSHGGENVTPTPHEKISRLVTNPMHYSYVSLFLAELAEAIRDADASPDELKELMARMMPEYVPFKTEEPVQQIQPARMPGPVQGSHPIALPGTSHAA